MANRVKLVSRFPAVSRAAYETVVRARDKALDAGEAEAERRLERIDDTHGWELPIDIGQETIGHQSGRIFYEPFYGRWFEYGTHRWAPQPFIRPAHRKMRKVFLTEMGGTLEGFIRRRAGV